MKCGKCKDKAVINMRQHNIGLCKMHFLAWIPEQTQRFIDKYSMFSTSDKILVAVSGGKDSLALWDILSLLGYKADGLYIGLGIDGDVNYAIESLYYCQRFAKEHNLNLITVDIEEEHGISIPQIAKKIQRGKDKPCSICGITKRHTMNRIAREQNYDVLATGHNLDDEAATLFGNTLHWQAQYLRRQNPVLAASESGLARKVKPLFRFYEREMAAYALLRGISYIYEECPFSAGAKSLFHKQLLNQLEYEQPGAKLQFYLTFLNAKETGIFTPSKQKPAELNICKSCGQPTSAPELCSFCRIFDSMQK
ncbi:MAG: ATP-binding protein [Chloroflexota bacterium]